MKGGWEGGGRRVEERAGGGGRRGQEGGGRGRGVEEGWEDYNSLPSNILREGLFWQHFIDGSNSDKMVL